MDFSVYELLWMFLIYAFFGWCAEVIYHAAEVGDFANRGFLNGPVCPIYGFGASAVIVLLTPFKNPALLFVLSMLLTSFLELLTGFVLKKLYHTSWWDYSDKPFNIGGYICLEFSILWGLACVGVIRILHPAVEDLIAFIPHTLGMVLLAVLYAIFIADVIVTAAALGSLNKRISLLDDMAKSIRRVSDGIGEDLYETVNKIERRRDEFDKSEEAQALKMRYERLMSERHIIHERIIKAFPKMQSLRYAEQSDRLKERIKSKKKR